MTSKNARGHVLRVWMSRPDWRETGGPVSHLPVLIDQLAREPGIDLRTFLYGGRRFGPLPRAFSERLPVKAVLTLFDAMKFLLLVLLKGRPHILHLNSVFDYFGMLRDMPYLLTARLFGFACLVKTHGSNERLIQDRSAMISACVRST
ncbi:MAG: hypothetical protein R3E54_06250 [Halioglobus sp.]